MANRGLQYPYVHELVAQIHAALIPHGYQLSLDLVEGESDAASLQRRLVAGRCDGMIKLGMTVGELETMLTMKRSGLPVVVALSDETWNRKM